MNLAELNYDELLKTKPYEGDFVFNVNDMTADEYISKITEEMNAIDLSSVPIDKWDIVVTFSLATLEVAGDFFIGDPSFKYSLANKDGKFCRWLNKIHEKASKTNAWWGHKGSPLDYQGPGYRSGDHRVKSIIHDAPLKRAVKSIYDKGESDEDKSKAEKAFDLALLLLDLIGLFMALASISSGKFIDLKLLQDKKDTKGLLKWLVTSDTNQKGTEYEGCNLFVAVVKYLCHMMADFFSRNSLPIPGMSLLTRVEDSKLDRFARNLYAHGMNMRTLVLQGIPVGITELLMSLYIWLRSENNTEDFSEAAWEHKKHKLLLISHGITTAVNVGKVVLTEAPWRLNLVVIARTFQLLWRVIADEAKLTNRHIEKLDAGILKARIESCKTLVLLDRVAYETNNVERMVRALSERTKDTSENIDSILSEVNSEFKSMLRKIGG